MTASPAPADEAVPTGNTYDKYASQNPVERRLMDGFFAALDASLPATPPTTVLEVGVGEGEVAERLRARWPEVPIAGIDLPDHELAAHWIGKAHSGAFADICRLPFPDDAFDLVLAIEVLEHVPDPIGALAELDRVCRRDVVLSVPRERIWSAANMARGKYLRDLGNTPGHINHWSKRGFAEVVGTTFTVRDVRSPFPWTMVAASVRRPA
ncbi:class I SAM-dependent methyltransferase [Iamia majanohamensis]|uniref:Class I SAM-dependent methyltransferase n=1 Tax=Iamia majanohamensis TaxID=467976 RepID=A0AAE9Y7T5_9ACTN|nr:class I SAM-dependent methyltransferase [Iamia majanohamensis]WCO68585.1 class I SAM-dependent methyltransferase [Iamia majanohamensis]